MRRTVGPSEESDTTPTSSVYSKHATGTQLRRRGPTLRCHLMISHMRFQVGYPTPPLPPPASRRTRFQPGSRPAAHPAPASAVHTRDLRIVHAQPGSAASHLDAGLSAKVIAR